MSIEGPRNNNPSRPVTREWKIETPADGWKQKTAIVKAFQLTPDMRGDFTRLLSAAGMSAHFTGAATPERIESFTVEKIRELRLQQENEPKAAGAAVRGSQAEEAQSRTELSSETLKAFEGFLARHGGDNARADLNLEQQG